MGTDFFYSHRCVSFRAINLACFNVLHCKLAKIALFIYSLSVDSLSVDHSKARSKIATLFPKASNVKRQNLLLSLVSKRDQLFLTNNRNIVFLLAYAMKIGLPSRRFQKNTRTERNYERVRKIRSSFRPGQGTHQRFFCMANPLGIAPKVLYR